MTNSNASRMCWMKKKKEEEKSKSWTRDRMINFTTALSLNSDNKKKRNDYEYCEKREKCFLLCFSEFLGASDCSCSISPLLLFGLYRWSFRRYAGFGGNWTKEIIRLENLNTEREDGKKKLEHLSPVIITSTLFLSIYINILIRFFAHAHIHHLPTYLHTYLPPYLSTYLFTYLDMFTFTDSLFISINSSNRCI